MLSEPPFIGTGHELVRPVHPLRTNGPLSPEDVDAFYRDGYVVARGLISGDLLTRAQAARSALHIPADANGKYYAALRLRLWETAPIFRELATSSPLPTAAAQLTPTPPPSTIRKLVVLRDALFVLRGDSPGCGFHVDDAYFWPSPLSAPGPGVNVWLALDPITPDGGGMALAPGSHGPAYLDCRRAVREGTCTLGLNDPAAAERLERIAVCPSMQPGDAIILSRWMFHRGDPFREGSKAAKGPGVARYSVRYMPGNACVVPPRRRKGPVGREVVLAEADNEEYPAWVPEGEHQ